MGFADGGATCRADTGASRGTPVHVSSVRLWSAENGELVWSREARDDSVAADFGPDGSSVVVVWSTGIEQFPIDVTNEAHRRKPRDLSPEELDRFGIRR